MVCRYFGVVFVLFFMMTSVNAKDNSSVAVTPSPVIALNSTIAANMTAAPSPVIISTSSAPTSASIRDTSSISPTSTSTSHVIPATSPTPTPPSTTAPTKKPNPHEKPTKGRSFDSASFFGGIILGVILAIASFVGYTFWQNKRKSYHSL
ncbi:sialomucin core protein 24-like [Actinia tenebrosa]|uniref:Sialomucin core protein 24-like n=1 Tax=Actinia tenebrosa TaxID=6105 RepID=A0A6P8IUN7_ACTTE|nr:sialomucin core protein 24-like [Actinia tenebrosa]